jgi:hypothetical protein
MEQRTDLGLVKGHAYGITAVKKVAIGGTGLTAFFKYICDVKSPFLQLIIFCFTGEKRSCTWFGCKTPGVPRSGPDPLATRTFAERCLLSNLMLLSNLLYLTRVLFQLFVFLAFTNLILWDER